jgi:glycosyltransferase involved in cell wall biosynthesis
MSDAVKKISIITPCFNEEASVEECVQTVGRLFAKELPTYELEHIFCDNCSTDRTVEILRELAKANRSVKIIVNSRNFGILKNTYNGVLAATGDAVLLFLPVDLQDPPELIPEFVKHWENGYEIVFGLRAEREEGFVIRSARKHGKSRNRLSQMFEQGLNGIISFSGAPVRAALLVGFVISFVSIIYSVIILLMALFGKVHSPAGIPTLIAALFFFGGVQIFFIGVLGEYILAIYNQVRRKPMVVERERINFD